MSVWTSTPLPATRRSRSDCWSRFFTSQLASTLVSLNGANGLCILRPLPRKWRLPMSVYSIWESRFPAESAEEGVKVTKAIWRDMLCFDGYLSHELIQDLDQPGHLFVVSRWASREVGFEETAVVNTESMSSTRRSTR